MKNSLLAERIELLSTILNEVNNSHWKLNGKEIVASSREGEVIARVVLEDGNSIYVSVSESPFLTSTEYSNGER